MWIISVLRKSGFLKGRKHPKTYKSKSVYGFWEKNSLSFWNMDARNARKAIREKVQVGATLGACKLWISQGRMCSKEIYNTQLQMFAGNLNRCCWWLHSNRMCDELLPTVVDAIKRCKSKVSACTNCIALVLPGVFKSSLSTADSIEAKCMRGLVVLDACLPSLFQRNKR